MVEWMNKAWDLTWHGKIALLKYDWETFGELMNRNHQLVDQMMSYCGFKDGAGEINNMLIEKALSFGALGAKLTGAGSGGSVFAMTHPGDEKKLEREWKKAADEAGLKEALIFRPSISYDGLKIEAK
jgi:mevalonate kinase